MIIKKNDYFIARDGTRNYLARALEDTRDNVEALLEKFCHIQSVRHTLTVDKSNLVVNLGQEPQHGKVYGCDVTNLYYRKKDHDKFGPVYFFYKPSKQVVKDLWESMDRVYLALKKRGLGFLLNNIIWEVLPHFKEKYAGQFIKEKGGKIPNRIQIRPEIMPASSYDYVLFHELGHHLHLTFATGKQLNAHWLRLFNTSIRVATVKKETSSNLLEELLAQEDLPSDFKSTLSEDDALAYKWVIRNINTVSALSIKELDVLFEAGLKDEIRKVWPVRTLPRKELAPVISDYATKNYKELFAEVFAFVLCKKKVPEVAVRLMEKSIAYAKSNREKTSSDDI